MIDRQELLPAVANRVLWMRRVLLVLLGTVAAVLFDMQVLRSSEYRAAAELNSVKRVPVRAPRGLLLDREGRVLVKNRPAFEAVVFVDRVTDAEQTLKRARAVLGLEGPFVDRLRRRLRRKNEPAILLKEDLSLAEVAALEARSYEWPEFRVRQGLVRSYPNGHAAAHVLGHMGEIRDDQLQDAAFRSYEPGDIIGQSGIEARYERYLRGKDGVRRVVVNNLGREVRELDRIDPPSPGLDLRLTLDLDVQRSAEAAFGALRGAAVAIDNRSGEVLAMVSRPAYDPNAFAGKLSREDWSRYTSDPAHPLFDRALLGKLPPGSVFKVVDSVAGLEERVWDPDTPVSCSGTTVLYGDIRHCWKKEGHGVVSFREALRGSCNVYFYHRGDALGIERIARWARRLGLGEPTGIDIDPEGRGVMPDPVWKRRMRREPWWPGETVSVAIGQGAIQVSVLQVAQMMQVVANGGKAWTPFLVSSAGHGGFRRAPTLSRDVALRPDSIERLRGALWAVVNEAGGTGGRARVPGVAVAGKTGTAQTPSSSSDPADAKEHAWFAGYAPAEGSLAVVAVFVEHGGHGGEAAAPIAGAILSRILEKNGLKPPGPPAPAEALVAAAAPEPAGPPAPGESLPVATLVSAFLGPPRFARPQPAQASAARGLAQRSVGGEGLAWAASAGDRSARGGSRRTAPEPPLAAPAGAPVPGRPLARLPEPAAKGEQLAPPAAPSPTPRLRPANGKLRPAPAKKKRSSPSSSRRSRPAARRPAARKVAP